jgi:penicillin-binding protein 1C
MAKLRTRTRRIFRVGLALAVAALAGWFVLPFAVPLPEALRAPPPASAQWLDRHGELIRHLALPDSTRATPVPLDEIPSALIDCTLAAEDKRFWSHGGVDLLAIARAATDAVRQREVVSGASTITQQLIKISSPPARRTVWAKLREALAARRLEMSWDKRRILSAYLNRLDYGNLRIGPAEAARFYFQKPLADLSLGECALLAGLPQAPSRLNPLRHPQRALDRRAVVLDRLAAAGKTDAASISLARRETPVFRPLPEPRLAPWLQAPPAGGSTARTTLDLALQRRVEAIVREETLPLREANLRHAAVVAIHNPTREILVLVSSADWSDARGGQINGALAPRSPGSVLKPFTYLLALDRNQRTPVSILADVPTSFRTLEGLDLPENYDRTCRGPVTLRTALASSLNLPALRELNALGGPRPLHDLLTQLGLTTLGNDPHAHGLGLTLGNAPARLLELTNAYATLATLGGHRPPVLFPDHPTAPEQPLLDPLHCYLIADILSDPAARASLFSPGGPLDLPFRCAAKTGTSSDFHDNWCIGYTPEFTVGVWAGNFEHQPMKGLSGVDGAGPIFHRTLRALHQGTAPTWFATPHGLTEVTVDVRTGKRLPDGSTGPHVRRDLVPDSLVPPVAAADDCDAEGRARLDASFKGWFDSRHNRRRGELTLDVSLPAAEPLRIITPTNGMTYLLDPEIPGGSSRLRPVTNIPGTVRWTSETLRIEEVPDAEPIIHLTPGEHHLTATDPRDGSIRHLRIRVGSL